MHCFSHFVAYLNVCHIYYSKKKQKKLETSIKHSNFASEITPTTQESRDENKKRINNKKIRL